MPGEATEAALCHRGMLFNELSERLLCQRGSLIFCWTETVGLGAGFAVTTRAGIRAAGIRNTTTIVLYLPFPALQKSGDVRNFTRCITLASSIKEYTKTSDSLHTPKT